MNLKDVNVKKPCIVGIDPAANGTTGMYLKWRDEKEYRLMTELKNDNSVDAASSIVNQILQWEAKIKHKIDIIAVEEVTPFNITKKDFIPQNVVDIVGVFHILRAVFKDRYFGFLPSEKNFERYRKLKETQFNFFKKSEHILDAYLLNERANDVFWKKGNYYNWEGKRTKWLKQN
jgi:hypothetical protein